MLKEKLSLLCKGAFALAALGVLPSFTSFSWAENTDHKSLDNSGKSVSPGESIGTSPLAANDKSLEKIEEEQSKNLTSSVSLLWNYARNNKITEDQIKSAGLEIKNFQAFDKSIAPKERLTNKQVALVRAEPNRSNYAYRIRARKKYIELVSKFQDLSPSLSKFLPEILTAWGEARNLDGFSEGDLLYQQAKIASVIHVLRNRVERHCKIKKIECTEEQKNKFKWAMATKRYQFSCFEPYDVNLAPVLLGSKKAKTSSLEDLPALDQKSLENIVTTLLKMEKKQILIDTPLGNSNSRHYITPVLVPYSKIAWDKSKKDLELAKARSILLVPSQKPTHLTIVPTWARQNSLISHPTIFVENTRNGEKTEQVIAPQSFVYFGGLQ